MATGAMYQVLKRRDGDQWIAWVPELPSAHTWSDREEDLAPRIREAIALVLDCPEDAFGFMIIEVDGSGLSAV